MSENTNFEMCLYNHFQVKFIDSLLVSMKKFCPPPPPPPGGYGCGQENGIEQLLLSKYLYELIIRVFSLIQIFINLSKEYNEGG